jgi:hypothetical protein
VWGYRLTQGLHVASGIAAIPLLLAKLWTVYPRLFAWPPVRSVRHALERLSVAVLVAAALFEVATGLLNTAQWYPWPFSFVPVHYAVAWLLAGALVLHIAVKAPEIRAHWSRRSPGTLALPEEDGADRRSLLTAVAAASSQATPPPGPRSAGSAGQPDRRGGRGRSDSSRALPPDGRRTAAVHADAG